MKASLAQALAQTLLNLAECLAVFFTTTLLASAFSKQLRTRVDLTKPLHLVAFGIGLLWTLIFAVPGAASVQFFMPDYIQVSFRTLFLNWLDLTPVCLIAPFVIAMLESPLNWASIRVRPYRIALLASLSLVLVATPVFTATVLPGRANSATIIGLYLTWPLVGVLSATSGLKGATFGLVLVGISCVIVTPFRPSSKTTCEYEDVETIRFNNMLWLQVCLLVESMSCLVFNLVLTKCEKARLSIECEVRIRTEQLEQAKARAEEANANKAAFISFLCHELRNPLHAVSNLTDLLLEQRANGETEPLKWDASSIVGVQPAVQPITRPGTPLPPSKDASCAWTRAVDTTALVSDPGSDPVTAVSLCTNYMLALLSDTLDVFKFESGAVRLEKTPTDLQQLFAEISAMASPRAASKGLVFRLEMATDVPKFGEVDPLRLQQVVNNLLSNRFVSRLGLARQVNLTHLRSLVVQHSFKFTPRGGTVKLVVELVPPAAPPLVDQSPDPASIISIEPCDSSLRNSSQDTSHESFITVPMTPVRRDTLGPQHGSNFRLRIRCSDSGIGIPHESLATLFDPWTQATSSTSAEYGGSGLGLSIAAQIVELFGGEIWAESELGAGTTFIMELPVVARRPEGSMVTRSARARSFSQRFATPSRRTASLASIHFDNDRAPTPIGKEPPAITPAIHQHLEPQSASSTATLDDETDPFPRARRLLTATDYLLDSEPPPDPVLPRTRRILVTDDSAINRKILVRMLSQCLKRFFAGERFIVDEAENGLEAVELVTKDAEEGNNEIELIFMDVVGFWAPGRQAICSLAHVSASQPTGHARHGRIPSCPHHLQNPRCKPTDHHG